MSRTGRLILTAAIAATLTVPAVLSGTAKASEITIDHNSARNGWDSGEPGLAPSVVRGSTFGKLFATTVAGQVYAQPLVVGNTVVVATEEDNVYGLDAQTGAIQWQLSLGPAWPASLANCTDISPDVGVTSTPVYDPAKNEIYVAAVVDNAKDHYDPTNYLFGINATSGQKMWQVPIQGAPVNSPTRPFDSLTERQRTGLLLNNGQVYIAYASYCDYKPYVGVVAAVSTTTHDLTMWSDESGLTDDQGGIWQSGGGLMSDGSNRIFLASGNGVSPPPGPGTAPPQALGDAVIRLAMQSNGTMAAQDFFSPVNAPTLNTQDLDVSSSGPIALPFGAATFPHLLIEGTKDGRLFVLNRDSLGGRGTSTDNVVSVNGPYNGTWAHPAAFAGANGNDFIYYLGLGDYLRALKFNTTTAKFTDAFDSTFRLHYGSGSPVVTSNGGNSASAVVWEVDREGATSTLDAFSAVPTSGHSLPLLWSAPIGTAAKFTTPATDHGRVYVATADGAVYGFGSPDSAPLAGSQANFGAAAVGSSPSQTVTVTANSTVTVTGVNASSTASPSPFTAGTPTVPSGPVTFPVTLTAGQQLSIPVTFAPTTVGGVTGLLNLTTTMQNFATYNVSLAGTGTLAGFYSAPASLSFGTVAEGSSLPMQTVITNSGTASETWSTIAAPSDPAFTITGQPLAGTQIAPGQSVTLNVTYAPSAAASDSASITEPSSLGGTTATVTLAGTGAIGQGVLSTTPGSLAFGNVPLGQQSMRNVVITNTGNLPMTISGFTAPGVPFGTPTLITNGIALAPGDDLTLTGTFSPQSLASSSGSYTLTASDGDNPPRQLVIPVSGTGVAPKTGTAAIPSPGGGWTLNGNAQTTGTALRLTQAVNSQRSSAVYYQPLASNALSAQFTTHLGGGTGANGITFGLLDASQASATSIGKGGSYLGFGGLPGVAVALATYPKSLVGIANGTTSTGLSYVASNTNVPDLRTGTHVVSVTVTGAAPSTITVRIDGTQYLSTQVNVPANVLAAFTGSTGSLNDAQVVNAVSVGSGTTSVPPPGGGWSYNKSAVMSGSDTDLTTAAANQTGTVVYRTPVPTNGLKVKFNMRIGGGNGADGLTFALIDPAAASITSVGGGSNELGFGGLSGVAAVFDTHKIKGYPSSNFAAIATGLASPGVLKFDGTVSEIPPLRTGTHNIEITVTGKVLTIYDDGVLIMQKSEAIPANALLAFTGATDTGTDTHAIRDVAITAP